MVRGLEENAWKASLHGSPHAEKAPGTEAVITRCSHHLGCPGLLRQEPAAVFSATRGASVRTRPVLINLLACLGRGLERGEEGKEVVEGKERKKPRGRRRVRRGQGGAGLGSWARRCAHPKPAAAAGRGPRAAANGARRSGGGGAGTPGH